jgi:hypothetical protein
MKTTVVENDKDLIQFKNEQSWTFKAISKPPPSTRLLA